MFAIAVTSSSCTHHSGLFIKTTTPHNSKMLTITKTTRGEKKKAKKQKTKYTSPATTLNSIANVVYNHDITSSCMQARICKHTLAHIHVYTRSAYGAIHTRAYKTHTHILLFMHSFSKVFICMRK